MPKINREEVKNEIYRLKRHQVEGLFSFFGPIEAVSLNQVIEIIDNAEPIEEYEKDYKGSWEHAIEFSGEELGESEETEVKKDLKWFKEQLDDIEMNTPRLWSHDSIWMLDRVNELLNQLDEPEVLSQEWIDEHKKSYTMEDSVEISDLQNLLVPKQDELEVKIQELIETYRQEDGQYSNPENYWIDGFIEDLKNLLEEEQKYVIDTDDVEISDGNHYLTHLSLSKDDTELPIVGYKDDAIRFDNKEQAQAIADYVGGRVEEMEEC